MLVEHRRFNVFHRSRAVPL